MQAQQSKPDTQFVSTGRKCSVCEHESLTAINSLLASHALSNRRIASQFKLGNRAVDRHASEHLPKALARAAERAEIKADDVFMRRHEELYAETAQYIQDAKGAVKHQRVTVPKLDKEGQQIGTEEHYQAFRDVGAMAPALQTAVQLQRVLGDATARFSSKDSPDRKAFVLVIAQPGAQVTIPTGLQPADDELTIDIKAIAE